MKQITLILSLAIIASISNAQTIVEENSKVDFNIPNMKRKTVEGSFTGMKGSVVFDKNDLAASSFVVSIDPATVNTLKDKRDKHLKNEDFFHVDKFTSIDFKSEEISRNGDALITKGKMTIHGVTNEVSIPFSIEEAANLSTFTGTFELNRFDYGLGAEKYGGTYMVGEVVTITITCVVNES